LHDRIIGAFENTYSKRIWAFDSPNRDFHPGFGITVPKITIRGQDKIMVSIIVLYVKIMFEMINLVVIIYV